MGVKGTGVADLDPRPLKGPLEGAHQIQVADIDGPALLAE
jgi:hypothetical protein